jgi:hypothetical protein
MDAPRIQFVKPLEKTRLLVRFVNGVEKIYDCSQLLNRDSFQWLKSEAFFRSVKVDPGGYGISWNDDVDLSEFELWVNGRELSLRN